MRFPSFLLPLDFYFKEFRTTNARDKVFFSISLVFVTRNPAADLIKLLYHFIDFFEMYASP